MRRDLLFSAMLTALAVAACDSGRFTAPYTVVTGGDAARGAQLIRSNGCGGCHTIPGIRNANGEVGPPLNVFARRTYIAGELPNNAANLIRWLRDPPSVEPGTAMPVMGLSDKDARDIAAYLYTLS